MVPHVVPPARPRVAVTDPCWQARGNVYPPQGRRSTMRQIWKTIDTVETRDGQIELKRRGDRDALITIAGRVLMSSHSTRSEEALAQLVSQALIDRPEPRVLVGGLGLGYTLKEALALLPEDAQVTVAELNAQVVEWCRGPVADLSGNALDDPRVEVQVVDVAKVIGSGRGRWDGIMLDLYEGPNAALHGSSDPLYGHAALRRTHTALKPGGVFAVWAEERDRTFENRLENSPFAEFRWHRPRRGARRHVNYLARRAKG